MKKIILHALAIMAVIAGSVSCSKDNVTPQSSMPSVSMSIIPDFSDGSVYSYSDDGSFFLRVSATPEEYLDKFGNDGKYIYRADFRKVITKASPEDPDFSVIGEITSAFVEEGYMTASFTLSEDQMKKMRGDDYVVSFSVKTKDGSDGFMTAFVPVSWYSRDGGGGEEEVVTLEAVDMGLSVKWANINLGANNPYQMDCLFMWGQTESNQHVRGWPLLPDWSNCPYCSIVGESPKFFKYVPWNCAEMWYGNGQPDNKTELELVDDAASKALGDEWRIPTKAEFEELVKNCTVEETTKGFVRAVKFKSKINGNSIILPCIDRSSSPIIPIAYWTSSLNQDNPQNAYYYDDYKTGYTARFWPFLIRPVFGKVNVAGVSLNSGPVQLDMGKSVILTASVHPSNAFDNSIVLSSSDSNVASVDAQGKVTAVSVGKATITATTNDGGFTATCVVTVIPNAVDLGLSVKWADINLGAYAPEVSGDYYAWGATAPNPGGDYSWAKCPYCSEGYGEKFNKYVPMGKMSYWGGSGSPDHKRELEPGDDAATAKLGGKWRTPTSAEFEELFKSCDTEWTTVNNVNGLKFTSRTNGNSIFLPATGHRDGNNLIDEGEEGLYMSSSLATDIPDHAMSFEIKIRSEYASTIAKKRNMGLTIRAVTE